MTVLVQSIAGALGKTTCCSLLQLMVPLVVRLCKETESAVRGINFGILSAKHLLSKIKCTMRMLKLLFFIKASFRTNKIVS